MTDIHPGDYLNATYDAALEDATAGVDGMWAQRLQAEANAMANTLTSYLSGATSTDDYAERRHIVEARLREQYEAAFEATQVEGLLTTSLANLDGVVLAKVAQAEQTRNAFAVREAMRSQAAAAVQAGFQQASIESVRLGMRQHMMASLHQDGFEEGLLGQVDPQSMVLSAYAKGVREAEALLAKGTSSEQSLAGTQRLAGLGPLDRSLMFTLLLQYPEFASMESRAGSALISDMMEDWDYAVSTGATDMGEFVKSWVDVHGLPTSTAAKTAVSVGYTEPGWYIVQNTNLVGGPYPDQGTAQRTLKANQSAYYGLAGAEVVHLDSAPEDGHVYLPSQTPDWRAQQLADDGRSLHGASFRDFMDEKSGKTAECKHCGQTIAEGAPGGNYWSVTDGGPGADICIHNKGTKRGYGGTHQPKPGTIKTAAFGDSSGFKPGDKVEDKDSGRKGTVKSTGDDGKVMVDWDDTSDSAPAEEKHTDPSKPGAVQKPSGSSDSGSKPNPFAKKDDDKDDTKGDDKGDDKDNSGSGNPFAKKSSYIGTDGTEHSGLPSVGDVIDGPSGFLDGPEHAEKGVKVLKVDGPFGPNGMYSVQVDAQDGSMPFEMGMSKDASGHFRTARVQQLIWQAASHDQDFSEEGPDTATLISLIDKYVQIVFYNEHGVATDYETGRIRAVHPDQGLIERDRVSFHDDQIEWQVENPTGPYGNPEPYPVNVSDIYSITRLEEPVDAGQQHLFGSLQPREAIGPYTLYDKSHGDYATLKARFPRSRTVTNDGHSVSYSRNDPIFSSPSVTEADDGKTTLNLRHYPDPYDSNTSTKHDLDGTKFDTQEDATAAAFDAGALAFMVYDNEDPAKVAAARSRCTSCGVTMDRDATGHWNDINGRSHGRDGHKHQISPNTKHRASNAPDTGQQCPSCRQYEVHHYDDNGGYNYCSNCDWSDHPERAHTGSVLSPMEPYHEMHDERYHLSDRDVDEAERQGKALEQAGGPLHESSREDGIGPAYGPGHCDYCNKPVHQKDGVWVHTGTGETEGPAYGQWPPHMARPQSGPSWEHMMSSSLQPHTAADVSLHWKQVIDAGMSREDLMANVPAYQMNDALAYWDKTHGKTADYKYVKQRGDKWVITQKGTGKVLSEHDSQEKAEASFRAMMQSKHGVQMLGAAGPLPAHLQEYWGNSTVDPRDNPNYCPKQSHKTPAIPWHNGYPTCLSCGKKATFNAGTGNVRYSASGLTHPMEFECNHCHTRFEGTSPKNCPNCGSKPDQHQVVGSLKTAAQPSEHATRYAEGLTEKFKGQGPWAGYHDMKVVPGSKYDKVVHDRKDPQGNPEQYGGSIHAFVEKSTGHVYKPAGYSAPAKGVRYTNVDDALSAADPYGSYLYLRHGVKVADRDEQCYACDGTGKASQGWGGNPSADGTTCPDCQGTGIDQTPYGTGMDSCPYCMADWRQPHDPGCPCSRTASVHMPLPVTAHLPWDEDGVATWGKFTAMVRQTEDGHRWTLALKYEPVATGHTQSREAAQQRVEDYLHISPEPLAIKALLAHDQTALVSPGYLWSRLPVGLSVESAYFSQDSVVPPSTSTDGPKQITMDHAKQQQARQTEQNRVLEQRSPVPSTSIPVTPSKASEVTSLHRHARLVDVLDQGVFAMVVKQSVNDDRFGSERYQVLDQEFPQTGWAGSDGFDADHSQHALNKEIPNQRITGWPSAWGQGSPMAPSEGSLNQNTAASMAGTNPYPSGTKEAEEWLSGWNDGYQGHHDGTDTKAYNDGYETGSWWQSVTGSKIPLYLGEDGSATTAKVGRMIGWLEGKQGASFNVDSQGDLDEPTVPDASSVPTTTRPQVTPGADTGGTDPGEGMAADQADMALQQQDQPAPISQPLMGDPSSFEQPTMAQRREAKIGAIAAQVVRDNPGIDQQQATHLARMTVAQFPGMVSEG